MKGLRARAKEKAKDMAKKRASRRRKPSATRFRRRRQLLQHPEELVARVDVYNTVKRCPSKLQRLQADGFKGAEPEKSLTDATAARAETKLLVDQY